MVPTQGQIGGGGGSLSAQLARAVGHPQVGDDDQQRCGEQDAQHGFAGREVGQQRFDHFISRY